MWYGHMLRWDPLLFKKKRKKKKEKGVYVLICMYIYVSTIRILVQLLQAPDPSPLLAHYPQAFERPRIRLLQAT